MDTQSSHGLRILDLFRLSLRVFKTKPLRTFLTIMGMSFGIGTVLFLVSFGYGLQYILIGKLVATEDSLITIEALYPSETELNITYDDLKIISQMPETAEISPIAEFTGEIKINDQFGSLLIKIVKPNYFRLSGQIPDIGSSFSESEPAVIISSQAVKLTGTDQKTNQQIQESLYKEFSFKVFYQNEKNIEIEESATKEPLKLKGIFTDESQLPFAIIPEDFLTKEPPFFKRILVKAKDINSIEALRDKLLEKGFIISARIDLVKQATKVMRIITIVLGVFGVAALIVAAVGMFNTMVVSFLERTMKSALLNRSAPLIAMLKIYF